MPFSVSTWSSAPHRRLIHLIGGFLAGLVIPKVNGYDIALVEKLEDFIGLMLLPQVLPACFS
jgi:hypothetical protein